jgi:transcription antitermination factor NusG
MTQQGMTILTKTQVEEPLQWFAIYTMYKSEKQVVEHLTKKNILAYIPLMNRTRKYGRKIKHYNVPLINCYVFVMIKKSEYVKVLETEHVLKFIKQGKEMVAIPQEEINVLKRIEGFDGEILPNSDEFEIGEEVQIKSGSLAGLKGKLVSRHGSKTFIVEIASIGVTLNMNVDVSMLIKKTSRKKEVIL